MLEDEFIGVVFRDDEDGDTCYHVQITVLAEDLMTAVLPSLHTGPFGITVPG